MPYGAKYTRLLISHIDRWVAHPSFALDNSLLKQSLKQAANDGANWLWHPCISAIFTEVSAPQRDLQLAVWVAINCADYDDRALIVEPMQVWVGSKAVNIERGNAVLKELTKYGTQNILSPDVWCESIGEEIESSWASQPPTSMSEQKQLQADLLHLVRALDLLHTKHQKCARWLSEAVRIIIPLHAQDSESFRSGSSPRLPGLVECDCQSELQVLEALVHEAAHLYLYRYELASPLVDPAHDRRYESPLRSEPRPLRGILLAYHALAFIACLYRDVLDLGLFSKHKIISDEHEQIVLLALEAERTLLSQSIALTSLGIKIFESTSYVLKYSLR
ncbi:hypothetical protein NIES30_17440 [Phormidium tenue NIES-30]|uniref:HEXXH motif domain-containing protein n=2 Tax=Phormidium tenue TaxID=126344 RepID=A0A1U7J206_9CYAN|nr:hypothetical protein NIES30_17440 [Phormidium tenue NIES-30]